MPAERSVDVLFDEFMADEAGTVRRVYEVTGQPYTSGAQRATGEYLTSHRRGRHGRVDYRMADLGLDTAELRAAVAAYNARFGVREARVD